LVARVCSWSGGGGLAGYGDINKRDKRGEKEFGVISSSGSYL